MNPVLISIDIAGALNWLWLLILIGLAMAGIGGRMQTRSRADLESALKTAAEKALPIPTFFRAAYYGWSLAFAIGILILIVASAIGLAAANSMETIALTTFWVGVGVAVVIGISLLWIQSGGAAAKDPKMSGAVGWCLLLGLLGAHLGYFLWGSGSSLLRIDASLWFEQLLKLNQGQFDFYGGLFGGVAGAWLTFRRTPDQLRGFLDRVTMPTALAIGVGFAFQWISGTTVGAPCSGESWMCVPLSAYSAAAPAFTLPESAYYGADPATYGTTLVVATPLIAAVLYAIVGSAAWLSAGFKLRPAGMRFAVFIAVDAGLRTLIEQLFGQSSGWEWSGTQIIALCIGPAAIAWGGISVALVKRVVAPAPPAQIPKKRGRPAAAARAAS